MIPKEYLIKLLDPTEAGPVVNAMAQEILLWRKKFPEVKIIPDSLSSTYQEHPE